MKFESWEIFHAATVALPKGTIQRIFTHSTRLVELWAANPRFCSCTARNPLDRIRDLLHELEIAGAGKYARSAIDYMAEPLGGKFSCMEGCPDDKHTVDQEIGDNVVAMGKLCDEIRHALLDGELTTGERIKIREYARNLHHEINELLTAAGIEGGA